MIYIKHSDKRSKSYKLKKTKIRNEAEKSSCLTASKCALNQKVLEKSASNTFSTDMGVFRPVLQWSLTRKEAPSSPADLVICEARVDIA